MTRYQIKAVVPKLGTVQHVIHAVTSSEAWRRYQAAHGGGCVLVDMREDRV